MTMHPTRYTPLGEAALQIETTWAKELLLSLTQRPISGVLEVIPALNVLTLLFDPLRLEAEALRHVLEERLSGLTPLPDTEGREVVLPVRFGGPDLGWCAEYAGMSEEALIQTLCALPFRVAFLGFTPGFGFLTGLPPHLQMPRLPSPRERLTAGSVALGGPWAGAYPRETPGGWRIVGHTDAPLFDLSRPDPVFWRPGDRVRWQRV